MKYGFSGLVVASVVLIALQPSLSVGQQRSANVVKVGLIETLFPGTDVEKEEKSIISETEPFAQLIERQAGLKGEFVLERGMPALIDDFQKHKIQMAVVHGVEYGWLRNRCKEAKPLLIAVQETLTLKAEVLVPKDSPVQTLADLKGKRLAVPKRPQPFTLFYLDHAAQQPLDRFFQKETVNNADAAVEAVIEGTADCTVIGNAAWDVYQDRKPGRAKRLKVVTESPAFPATVIVYNELESNDETLAKFRQSLLTADSSREGRQALNLWRVSSFQDVPKNYDQQVDDILKQYPAEEK